jgi:hypothetical protein
MAAIHPPESAMRPYRLATSVLGVSLLACTALVACGGGSSGTTYPNASYTGTVNLMAAGGSASESGSLRLSTDAAGVPSGTFVVGGTSYTVSGSLSSTGVALTLKTAGGTEAGSITAGDVYTSGAEVGISGARITLNLPTQFWPGTTYTGFFNKVNGSSVTEGGTVSLSTGTSPDTTGTVTISGVNYSASGSMTLADGLDITYYNGATPMGKLTGGSLSNRSPDVATFKWSASNGDGGAGSLDGTSSATAPASSATAQSRYTGSVYASGTMAGGATGSGSGSGSGSSGSGTGSGGTSGAACTMDNYAGPKDDPQTWTFCASAYAYKCAGDATAAAKTCGVLDGFLKAVGSQSAKSYCPKYC